MGNHIQRDLHHTGLFLIKMPVGDGGATSAAILGARELLPTAKRRDTMSSRWLISGSANLGASPGSAWDAAHEQLQQMGLASQAEAFVEPDLAIAWPQAAPSPVVIAARGFPPQPAELTWYAGDKFSQFDEAIADRFPSGTVRIAHLDTGYDPRHVTFPRDRLEKELERNFVDPDRPNDASDSDTRSAVGFEPIHNRGHGTATLAILAAAEQRLQIDGVAQTTRIGCAPMARVVCVRIGNGVVQLNSTSVAQAIQYVAQLAASPSTFVDVITMSVGGVASKAWADAVNLVYDRGVFFAAASGDNYGGWPTRYTVFPARFNRVVSVCGVMANGEPYYDLGLSVMAGNWGPKAKMETSISACTPQMPWARIDTTDVVSTDGAGTSSSTPQVAAAAALYALKYAEQLKAYSQPWMRVEAIRKALFDSAAGADLSYFGRGLLRAADALKRPPASAASLKPTPPDTARWALLRGLFGAGAAASSACEQMYQLELTQLAQRSNRYDDLMDNVDNQAASEATVRDYLDRARDDDNVSDSLRHWLKQRLGGSWNQKRPAAKRRKPQLDGPDFRYSQPVYRFLRCYATDPAMTWNLDSAHVSTATIAVPWEKLSPGPVGEYIEVIDHDPASNACYQPINLDDVRIVGRNGLRPSEGVPQFHQQMVYAVASMTIRTFEEALGRRILWRADKRSGKPDGYVQRLRIYPHAFRGRNAYYQADRVALLFGYFNATDSRRDAFIPGSRVFTCLSHDIIAHESTHALLDGLNARFLDPSNPDVIAFHEAFADIVAMFQHFSFAELLRHEISRTRGDIRSTASVLGIMAVQFGKGSGGREALRSAIGSVVDGVWTPNKIDPTALEKEFEPHARGAILVAAVFDAFLSIYEARTADLIRLASEGSGILRPGAIHPDLVNRLAKEAGKAASHVLRMCVRAIDYCPPTDITFGDYLRALITADVEAVPYDDLNYRVAVVEAFRRRGIYPMDLRTLGVDSLVWRGAQEPTVRLSNSVQGSLSNMVKMAGAVLSLDREALFHFQVELSLKIEKVLEARFKTDAGRADAEFLGLDPANEFNVESAHFAAQTSADGPTTPQLVIRILQEQERDGVPFRGGATVIVDLKTGDIKYCIRKRISSKSRLEQQKEFLATQDQDSGLYGCYLTRASLGVFAALHGASSGK